MHMHNRQHNGGTKIVSMGVKLISTTRSTTIIYILLYAVMNIHELTASDVRS